MRRFISPQKKKALSLISLILLAKYSHESIECFTEIRVEFIKSMFVISRRLVNLKKA